VDAGAKISGVAHLLLIGWAVLGGAFRSEPLPFEVQDVTVITGEDYAAMMRAVKPPEPVVEPAALPVPEPETAEPDLNSVPDARPERNQPEPAPEPEVTQPPEPVVEPELPETEVTDTAPTLEVPDTDVTVLTPQASEEARKVDRVAPVPVAPPAPDARPDEVENPEVAPDEGAEVEREAEEATAPEEATTEVVTEAEEGSALAPRRSLRPPRAARPERVVRQPEPEPEEEIRSAVDAAVREAMEETAQPEQVPTPTGPPLSAGEKDKLRVSVSRCWNVGSLSSAALATTVVVGVSMKPDGKPDTASIRLLSSSGGDDLAARQAFEAARRAIIRCGAAGYKLPPEKYGHWRDIEMTFNPERMRIK